VGAQPATCGRLILARQHASASNQTGRAVEEHAEDRLIGGARGGGGFNLGFRLNHTGGEFKNAQSQDVELHDVPDRAFRMARRIDHSNQ
jgi:hypothetical protein